MFKKTDITPFEKKVWLATPTMHGEELEQKLEVLKAALASEDKAAIRTALHRVVPTFREPEEVNDAQGDTVEIPAQEPAAVC